MNVHIQRQSFCRNLACFVITTRLRHLFCVSLMSCVPSKVDSPGQVFGFKFSLRNVSLLQTFLQTEWDHSEYHGILHYDHIILVYKSITCCLYLSRTLQSNGYLLVCPDGVTYSRENNKYNNNKSLMQVLNYNYCRVLLTYWKEEQNTSRICVVNVTGRTSNRIRFSWKLINHSLEGYRLIGLHDKEEK